MSPDQNVSITIPTPAEAPDTSSLHLYVKQDTLWYRDDYELVADREGSQYSTKYTLKAEWKAGSEYSLEADSAAWKDIYGKPSKAFKTGIRIPSNDDFSSLFLDINGFAGQNIVVQLLDKGEKVVKEVKTSTGNAEIYYITPGTYYLRMYVDENGNGLWDTGDYASRRQPEPLFYYPDDIECKAKWDVKETWNPTAKPLNEQKPGAITKQKADKEKSIRSRNQQRAKDLGIEYVKQEL